MDMHATGITVETVAEHIVHVEKTCARFNINDHQYFLNLDETGVSLKPSARVRRRRTIGIKIKMCLTTQMATRNIAQVILMGIFEASRDKFNPAVLYPASRRMYDA